MCLYSSPIKTSTGEHAEAANTRRPPGGWRHNLIPPPTPTNVRHPVPAYGSHWKKDIHESLCTKEQLTVTCKNSCINTETLTDGRSSDRKMQYLPFTTDPSELWNTNKQTLLREPILPVT